MTAFMHSGNTEELSVRGQCCLFGLTGFNLWESDRKEALSYENIEML